MRRKWENTPCLFQENLDNSGKSVYTKGQFLIKATKVTICILFAVRRKAGKRGILMRTRLFPIFRKQALLFLSLALFFLALPGRAAAVDAAGEEATAVPPWRGITYIVIISDDNPLILDGSGQEPDFTGYPLTFVTTGRYRDLATAARKGLTIRHNGQVYEETSKLEALSVTFRRLGISVGALDSVLVNVSARGAIDVTVASDHLYYARDVEELPYQTIRRANPDMEKGEEDVVQVGSSGEKGFVYEVLWSNGAETTRQLVEALDSPSVDEIIEYGTAEPKPVPSNSNHDGNCSQTSGGKVTVERRKDGGGTLTLRSGEILTFSTAHSMTATAYTAGHGGVGSRTASGTPVREGVVAVDPRVIPLGTRLFIVANGGAVYGRAVAEDTGVRGNRIDLYYDTYQECINFGRRDCIVYVLE